MVSFVVGEADADQRLDRALAAAAGIPLFSDGVPMGTYYPMPREARLKGTVAGGPDPDEACRSDPGSVYCNSLSPGWWQPPGGDPAIMIGEKGAAIIREEDPLKENLDPVS